MTDLELAGPLGLDVLDRMPAGVVLTDTHGMVAWANAAFYELLGGEPESLVGRPLASVLRAPSGEIRDGAQRYHVRDFAGRRRWLQAASSPVSVNGGDGGALHVFTDLTEFETRGPGRLATKLGLDLGGVEGGGAVLDRKGILRELGAQVSRCRRYGNPLGVLLLRFEGAVDGEVPDDGDRRRAAARVNACVRWVDFVGATAVDELLVLMPETSAQGTSRVAAKLEEALAEAAQDTVPGPCATITTAEWARDDDADRLLARLHAGDPGAAVEVAAAG